MKLSAKPRSSTGARTHRNVQRARFLTVPEPERTVPILRFPIAPLTVITAKGRIVRIAKKR